MTDYFRNEGQGATGIWHYTRPLSVYSVDKIKAISYCGKLWEHVEPRRNEDREYSDTIPAGDIVCRQCTRSYASSTRADPMIGRHGEELGMCIGGCGRLGVVQSGHPALVAFLCPPCKKAVLSVGRKFYGVQP